MTKRERRSTNIDEDQAVAIELLPEMKRQSFAAVVRMLIDEALSFRKGVKITPSQVVMLFAQWGRDQVLELTLSGIKYLSEPDSGSEADRFLKNLHERRRPSESELVLLADTLDIPTEELVAVVNCFFEKGARKSSVRS